MTMATFTAAGRPHEGYLALPPSGAGNGVLVLHAWWGLNDFFKSLCDRLASQGFVAFAPDLYGDGTTAATIETAQQKLDAFDDQQGAVIAQGAADYLHSHPAVNRQPIRVMGFSMGAAWATYLSAARPEAVTAVVIFYGASEANFAAAQATYLAHFGEDDEWESMEYVRQMETAIRAAGRDLTLYTYPGAGHWFFESNRPGDYQPEAAALAWQRTLAFLRS
ncbi:MAG: dienelactone hydrolase family protein [Chloroflexota bacterium]